MRRRRVLLIERVATLSGQLLGTCLRGRGSALIARGTSANIGVHRKRVWRASHLEVIVALVIVEDVVNLLPTEPLQLLELLGWAHLTFSRLSGSLVGAVGVLREEGLVGCLLIIGLQFVLPLLVEPVEADDLLAAQVELLLEPGVIEGVEPLILHLELAKPLALQWVLEELIGLLGELLIELIAKLREPQIPLFVRQVGWQLIDRLLILLHQPRVLLANLGELVAGKSHLLGKRGVAKQSVFERWIRAPILIPLVGQTDSATRLGISR